jgi:hypothetical protein
MALRGNGGYNCCDPLILEKRGNTTRWFVEWSRRDFEQVGWTLLAHHPIHRSIVILSQGKKLKGGGDQAILVM